MANSKLMRILISNDDGYQAQGIIALTQALSNMATVVVLAPSVNQSASSSSLSINQVLSPIKVADNHYYLDGTPSDCVHLALCGFFDEPFDLVVSGINAGANLGDDVVYSGTVAAAIEGRFLGLPSMAISLTGDTFTHFDTAAQVAKNLVQTIQGSDLLPSTILNVNVPDKPFEQLAGLKTTRLGKRHASEAMIAIKDKSGRPIGGYQIGENGKEADNGIGTDFYAIANDFVSITPLQIDLTNYQEMDKVKQWLSIGSA